MPTPYPDHRAELERLLRRHAALNNSLDETIAGIDAALTAYVLDETDGDEDELDVVPDLVDALTLRRSARTAARDAVRDRAGLKLEDPYAET